MSGYRSIQVRDCQGTLWAFFREFDGRSSASFEGDLQALNLSSLSGASELETPVLKRQTESPQLDFCVVPIANQNTTALKQNLSSSGVLGTNGAIIHVQIEAADELIFSACDNFHDDCAVVSASVPKQFLIELQTKGLIRGFSQI